MCMVGECLEIYVLIFDETGPRIPLWTAPASDLTSWTFLGALWEPAMSMFSKKNKRKPYSSRRHMLTLSLLCIKTPPSVQCCLPGHMASILRSLVSFI